jgi:hypothetical protein
MKTLTNTFKLIHRNVQNTSKTSCLRVEESHTPHESSLSIVSMPIVNYLNIFTTKISSLFFYVSFYFYPKSDVMVKLINLPPTNKQKIPKK